MRLKCFDIDSFSEDLSCIKDDKIEESGKLTSGGLFSQQIFGPIKSYKCACTRNIFKYSSENEEICQVCGVELISSEERSKRYAKIKLPFPIINPLIYMLVLKAKPSIKDIINNTLYYNKCYKFNEDDNKETELVIFDSSSDHESERLEGAEGVKKIILYLCSKSDKPEFNFISENVNLILLNNLLVMPPAFRNFSKGSNGTYTTDVLNKNYTELLQRIKRLNDMNFDYKENSDIHKIYFKSIQKFSIQIYEYVVEKLSKKTGLIRGNILGKRVDFSGRAVISPDPTLNLDECRIPYLILLEMYKPKLITYLVNRKVVNRHTKASELIEKCILENNKYLVPFLEDFIKDKVCILNRQPSLHRLSVLAFKIKISPHNTINIHPLCCSSYNADFDGDQMAVYIPTTEKCADDININLGIWNNLISPTDGMIVPKPNQDIILGIYTATKFNSGKTFLYKNVKLSKNRYLFNKCLPESYPVVDEIVDKKVLMNILNDIALNYNSKECIKTLDSIKNLGFELSTEHGYTLSIDDLYIEEFEYFVNTLNGSIKDNIYKLNNNKSINNKIQKKPYYIYIESGARGSIDQLNQLIVSRGYVADANNKIRPNMIRSNLTTGLNQREFFESCWGSRKGILDTALSTGSSGYLTRQLVYSTVNMIIGEEKDCQTKDYLEMDVVVKNSNGTINESKSEDLAKSLIWRYIVSSDEKTTILITKDNYKVLIGRKIKLRSPIYCKSKHICKKCYGNLNNILHSDQIGIIATHALAERTTQMVLRTFHISGQVKETGDSDENKDIISGIGIVNKLFHKPSNIKGIESPIDLVMALQSVFSQYGNLMNIHYEVIVSSMMWTDKKLWRLSENRNNNPYTFESILKIPSLGSWLLGISFARLKNKLLDGLVNEEIDTPSSITNLFRY